MRFRDLWARIPRWPEASLAALLRKQCSCEVALRAAEWRSLESRSEAVAALLLFCRLVPWICGRGSRKAGPGADPLRRRRLGCVRMIDCASCGC